MNKENLVSIIIPVYNGIQFLEEAIESVINQTYKNLEIVIIDDGSNDGSSITCDHYACIDNRIQVVHQENKGLSNARNCGLEIINGDYIAFLDSDDAFDPGFIESMLTVLKSNKCDMVICKFTNHYTEGKLKREGNENIFPKMKSGLYDHNAALRALAEGDLTVTVWNQFYKNDVWKDLRFSNGHVFEDMSIAFDLIDRCNTVYVLDIPLYMHRKSINSLSNKISKDNIFDCILAYSKMETFINNNITDIFTYEQLLLLRKRKLHLLLYYYMMTYQSDSEENTEIREILIEALSETKNVIENDNLVFKEKMACHIAIHFPTLFRAIYFLYPHFRKMLYYLSKIKYLQLN